MPLTGSCHCRATQFEVAHAPTELTDCNCSFCAKRGALHAYYLVSEFRLITARDRVATYQWGTFVGRHHHCAICGCPTYSEFPDFSTGKPDFDNPRVGVNARLFDPDAFDIHALPVRALDGRNGW